jgi:hypothetical protein
MAYQPSAASQRLLNSWQFWKGDCQEFNGSSVVWYGYDRIEPAQNSHRFA